MTDDEGPIHHGNDKLFKVGFSDPVNTAAFLRKELAPAIAQTIDWEKLQLIPGSFIDSQFRKSETDLLFSAPIQEADCFFYLLFEHQTQLDPWLQLRLLRYMVRIWEEFLKQNPATEKLPIVFPVVLAQNGVRWQVDTRFSSLLDIPSGACPDIHSHIPEFEYRLLQLADMSYESIQGTATGILILRAMKAGKIGELLHQALWDDHLLAEIPQRIFEMVLRYILGHDIDKEAFNRKVLDIASQETRSAAMTLAQQFRQEGQQEGSLRSRQQDVLEILNIRFGRVPVGLSEALEAVHDDARLKQMLRTAVQCADLEGFAQSL